VQLCRGLFHPMEKLIGIYFYLPAGSGADVYARPIFATESLRLSPFSAKLISVCSVGTNNRLSDPLFTLTASPHSPERSYQHVFDAPHWLRAVPPGGLPSRQTVRALRQQFGARLRAAAISAASRPHPSLG